MSAEPKGCVFMGKLPRGQAQNAIIIGGRYVNQSAIARSQNLDQSYVGRILKGVKTPSIPVMQKIAAALGMGLQELIDAIDERKERLLRDQQALLAAHKERVKEEDRIDLLKLGKGIVPPPRIPGTRQPVEK